MAGPLAGVRVVELAAVVAGPWASMILADQGADVVKIEAPGTGDITRMTRPVTGGVSAFYVNLNRGKRSIAVDITTPAGREVVLDLVRTADVFIENYRPGPLERRGLGYGDLAAVRPELVHVSITGFGPTGPYAGRRAYDPVIQGLTGHAALQVNPQIPIPDVVRTVVCDKATALTVAQSVSAALFARERGAGGQHLEVAMLDAALAFFWPDGMMADTFLADVPPGKRLAERYHLTRTADGYLTYFVAADAEFTDLLDALDRRDLLDDPQFATMPARAANHEKLGAILAGEFARWPTAEIIDRMSARGVAVAPVLAPADLADDPQIRHNQAIRVRTHPTAGDVREPRPPVEFPATPLEETPLAPLLGEHTDEVLAELGYDQARIAELRSAGVVA